MQKTILDWFFMSYDHVAHEAQSIDFRTKIRSAGAGCEIVRRSRLAHSTQHADMDEKINILINVQIQNEERFAKSDERFARFEVQMDQTLKALMGIVKKLRNGHS